MVTFCYRFPLHLCVILSAET